MFRFDDVLLDHLYQPIYDATGQNRISITRSCLIGYIVFTVAYLLLIQRGYVSHIFAICGMTMFWVTLCVRRSEQGFVNTLRIMLRPLRIIYCLANAIYWCLFLFNRSSLELADLLDAITDILGLSLMYFASCSDRPPVKQAKWKPTTSWEPT